MRSEGEPERKFTNPVFQSVIFHNVMADHVDELLNDPALVKALKTTFQERGLTGELWTATIVNTGQRMNKEQMPILTKLMENESYVVLEGGPKM